MSNLEGKQVRGYRLDIAIGSGGFGTVYHAYQEILNREVVVKVINEKYVNQPQFIRQFESEARIIARLEHFNIVALYDYWRDPSGAFLVMRWLRGGSLRAYMRQAKLTVPQIVRLLNQISSSLHFAHSQNVIHRDIKPENILLDDVGNAYLTDFGIAVDLRNKENLDVENISFGSPDYVAPEQLTDHLITPQADIYSLGIMLYELLANERPFKADNPKDIMKMQLNNPVPSLRLLRPDLPPEIDTIIWQATAKRPTLRYDSVLELAVAFQSIANKISDVPPEYLISTEMRSRSTSIKSREVLHLPKDSVRTEGFDTGVISDDAYATGVLDGSETGSLDAGQTNVVEPNATGVLDNEFMQTDSYGISMPTSNLEEGDIVPTMALVGEGPANPYKGLRPFEEADAESFFGREAIVRRLVNSFDSGHKRFLALIGPSGSGKSSIVRAGMIPEFKRGVVHGSGDWFYTTMVPSDDPFRELSEALLRVAISAPDNWLDTLRKSPQSLHKLLDVILPDDGSDLFLFIDQFEEVFTQGDDEEARLLFLGSLWYAVSQPRSRLRLVITLRADFYDRPLYYAQFGELLQKNTEVVLPLSLTELEAAILRPAKQVGLLIDPALTSAILQDVQGQPGALPLLQYALTEMYERREGHRLGHEEYIAIGGISGALAKRAEEIFYSRLNDSEQNLARQVFLRIITIDENGTATRRRAGWAELSSGVENPESLQSVIDAFSQHRLLTIDRDPVTRSPTVEIAHEALINGWQQLRQWIEQNRAALQKRQELRSEVDRWLSLERDKSYLATGNRLNEFEALLNNRLLALRPEEQEFIQAGVLAREESIRRTQRINVILTVFSIVTTILALAAGVSFLNANEARADAEAAAIVARSRELAANSAAVEDENDLALLLAVEALNVGQSYEAVNSLLLALQEDPFASQFLHGHTGAIRALDFNSTGERAVSASFDNSLIIWDMTTYTPVLDPLIGHNFSVNAVSYSPDDSLIASAGGDSIVRLWDSNTGELLVELEGHDAVIWSLVFSPDGSRLLTGDEAGVIMLWDVESRQLETILEHAPNAEVYALAYQPQGSTFASAGGDNLVRLFNAESFEVIAIMQGHSNWVRSLAYSPDGVALVSAGLDGFLRFWNGNTGEELTNPIFSGHSNGILHIAYAPYESSPILATAGVDFSVRLFDLSEQGRGSLLLAPQNAHAGSVWGLAFDPQRFALLTGAEDEKIIYWDFSRIQRPGVFFGNFQQTLAEFALSADGSISAVAGLSPNGGNGVILVWDLNTKESRYELAIETPEGSESSIVVTDLQISPDGQYLVAALSSGEITVWDLATGDELWSNLVHNAVAKGVAFSSNSLYSADENGVVLRWNIATGTNEESAISISSGVTAFAISPDGQYLAITGRDNRIYLWNLAEESLIGELSGHSSPVMNLLFNADSSRLISGGRDNTAILWRVPDGNLLRVLEGHNDWVLSFAISPDAQYLASGDRQGGLRLWDLATGRPIGTTMFGVADWVTGLHFLDNTRLLASNQNRGILLEWTISLEDWLARACDISNRQLTEQEWAQYFPDEPYAPQCSSIEN